jgi:hypothetical protein
MAVVHQVIAEFHWSKRILPIQSWAQFTSFILCVSIGLFAFILVVRLFDKGAIPIWIFPFAILGASPVLIAVLPGQLQVDSDDAREIAALQTRLLETLGNYGYSPYQVRDNRTFLRTSLPRWLRWKENEVSLASGKLAITVFGPKSILETLRLRLLKEAEAQPY